PEFQTVGRAKRFFTVGRIFKTAWFEPGGEGMSGRRSDLEWTEDCPKYHGASPYAKFRWFIVVRKKPHHTLCFSITTYHPGKSAGSSKTTSGQSRDDKGSVVLYSADVEPPEPEPEEGITRKPIAIIREDKEQYISPLARLDCSRIYTVEDNLRVMKVGRVHTDSLPDLDECFRKCME
ncbi:hypothetical protein B0H67DRAFT_482022, partial [Lasiosphaeris hirsuta]